MSLWTKSATSVLLLILTAVKLPPPNVSFFTLEIFTKLVQSMLVLPPPTLWFRSASAVLLFSLPVLPPIGMIFVSTLSTLQGMSTSLLKSSAHCVFSMVLSWFSMEMPVFRHILKLSGVKPTNTVFLVWLSSIKWTKSVLLSKVPSIPLLPSFAPLLLPWSSPLVKSTTTSVLST